MDYRPSGFGGPAETVASEPVAAADGGRDPGFSGFIVAQRGRRC